MRAQSGFPGTAAHHRLGAAFGAADVGARAPLAAVMEKPLKQPVVVDNRTGGNFQIAWQGLQSFPADGHTLAACVQHLPGVHAAQKPFDMEKQSMPITVTGSTPILVLVGATPPYKTLGELLAFARANPGKGQLLHHRGGTLNTWKMAQF